MIAIKMRIGTGTHWQFRLGKVVSVDASGTRVKAYRPWSLGSLMHYTGYEDVVTHVPVILSGPAAHLWFKSNHYLDYGSMQGLISFLRSHPIRKEDLKHAI